jgi:hypothetical protein
MCDDSPRRPKDSRPRMLKSLVIGLVVIAALIAGYTTFVLKWSYSSGERAGWVQKFSKKGWICKTWEGELALVSLPGSSVEKFYFTVHSDAVAAEINKVMGRRVSLHYEEKVGLPTSCFGETRHFVSRVVETLDVPLSPGVTVPGTPRAAAPASAAAPAAPASAP